MPSTIASGTHTLAASEGVVTSQLTNITCVLRVNLKNLLSGDLVRLRLKARVLLPNTDTDSIIVDEPFSGAQLVQVWQSIPLSSPHNLVFSAWQPVGTFRQIDWSLEAFA